MSEHFNRLTPAQAERLALLAEEAGELVHIIGKALRHGLDSSDPTEDSSPTNAELIAREVGDLNYATKLLIDARDIQRTDIVMAMSAAVEHKPRWMHHQQAAAPPADAEEVAGEIERWLRKYDVAGFDDEAAAELQAVVERVRLLGGTHPAAAREAEAEGLLAEGEVAHALSLAVQSDLPPAERMAAAKRVQKSHDAAGYRTAPADDAAWAMLRELEWLGNTGNDQSGNVRACPLCFGSHGPWDADTSKPPTHAPDCRLAALLASRAARKAP